LNNNTEASLQITEEEKVMLTDALTAYIKWKNIESANPGTALAIAVGVVCLRVGVTTVQNMTQNRAMYQDFLKKNYAPPAGSEPVNMEDNEPEQPKGKEV
jgi:hypothetical protein